MTWRYGLFRKPPPQPSGVALQTEVLAYKEPLDAEIGGDYIAASADFRVGDAVEGSSKELVDTNFRGD